MINIIYQITKPTTDPNLFRDSFKLLLCTKSFYALLVSMMAIGVAQLICGDFVKVYGSVVIKDDKFFNDAGIAIHATNALSRWVVPNPE